MIPVENKRRLAHPRLLNRAPFSSLLRESRSRDAPLTPHLMLRREGRKERKEGGREGGK